VRWECALLRASDGEAVAIATSAHVFVDRQTRRPVPVPAGLRPALEALVTGG
jgi:acyl-CoA thioester hydrolase